MNIVAAELASINSGNLVGTNATGVNSLPGPVPEIQSEFIRQIPLIVNDVVYSPLSGKLYASVPSSGGSGGNSIATIDPLTGVVTNSVFIGSEPNKLALSDDGHTLYVSLDGAFSIRRFDTTAQIAGAQFPIGMDQFSGWYTLTDLAVAPGNPNLVAVARSYRGISPPTVGVAVYDNGVRRTLTGPGHSAGSDYLAFSASASKLYGSGFGSGLVTLNIDANGVTVASTTSLSSGFRIKFDNGRVYGGSGQVINPDTGTLLGTLSGTNTNAFVPDSVTGRAYYLAPDQFGGSTRTLKAFDINTFLPVGTAPISGIVGDPTTMIRWGSNGLAFRTTGNQLFIVQTSLIPSADPIPTPTPTPSPSPSPTPTPPVSTFIRQLSLATNDLVFNPTTQSLHASVPSSAGSTGNSIASIDPVAGTIGSSIFVGSEPNKLALSSDGQTLYVGLDGAGSVRRFETVSQTAGGQFPLGNDNFYGPRLAAHLAVMPGNSGTVAVARTSSNVAIYDNGIPRPQAAGTSGPLEFGSLTTLYVAPGVIQKLDVSPSGVSLASTTSSGNGGSSIDYVNGLIYMSGGSVVDPEAQVVKGTFGGLGFNGLGFNSLMAVDAANGRVFFLNNPNSTWVLRSFDINTFLPIASTTIQGITGTPSSLVRWGTNGLAFRTSNRQVFLIQTALVNASEPIPAATPTPSPTPSPSPAYVPTFVQRVDLPANDLVYNQGNSSLYASVPSVAGANGNSITRINPATAVIGPSVFIGSEPNKLALSDDGTTLYANLDGANAIRRFDVTTQTPGPQFSSTPRPVDMDVVPGSPTSLAVSRNNFSSPLVIYDNGVPRPNSGSGPFMSIGAIEFGPSASTLYAHDNGGNGSLMKVLLDASGVVSVNVTNALLQGFSIGLKYKNGLLYTGSGRVVDPEAKQLVGTFQGTGFSNVLAVDTSIGRAFYLSSSGPNPVLSAYDINTFLPLGSITLNGVVGNPVSLVRWGTNGLAFNTVSSGFGSMDPTLSRVYLLQSALVSSAAIPTGVQFSADKYSTSENFNVTLAITRAGDVSAPTTVNYATSDGTATAGSDYTTTSGSVTFLPGELSKTITVPTLNDNIYEGGSETFNVTLSNPTGGALLTSPTTAIVTIHDSQFKPSISGPSVSVAEGDSGTKNFPVVINLSNASFQAVTVDYTTASGTATAGDDFVPTSGTVTFEPGSTSKTVNIQVNGDTLDEPNETFLVNLSNATNASGFQSQITATILNDDGPAKYFFSTSNFTVNEGAGVATITVMRLGGNTETGTVDYATSDASAQQSRDYTVATGTLVFAPGQTSRTFRILINDDGYAESTEFLGLILSRPTGTGATLGTPAQASLNILNNDPITSATNPIDGASFFVRAHYSDFLGRVPDDEGLAYWTSQITQCGTDAACIRDRRVAVSNAFFYEQEYHQTASYVFLLYRAAYGDNQPSPNPDGNLTEARKLPRYLTFVRDRARVVGGSNLAQSQLTLASAFVQRPEFLVKYPASLSTGEAFVDAVLATIQSANGAVLTHLDRNTLVAHFNNGGRGLVMFHLANDYWNGCESLPGSPAAPCVPAGLGTGVDNRPFLDAEYTRSFVYSQYSGYLRRDAEMGGFLFWLNEVNKAAPRTHSVQRAMVCSFITSAEYQQRFNLVVTHTNADCP